MTHQSLDPEELREALREVLSVESTSRAVRDAMEGNMEFRSRIWTRMAELGWLGLAIDADYGGLGLGVAEAAIAYEEFGRYLTPVPFMTTLLGAEAVASAGNAAQKAAWLPRLASGAVSASLALPHFNGVVRVASLASDARLRGTVSHVLDAGAVDLLFMPIVSDDSAGGFAIIDRGAGGVSITERAAIDRTRTLCDVTFADVEVPSERILRPAASVWDHLIDHAAVALACDSIGGAAHILEKTVEYLKTRVQFNRPIGSFQALKHRCATWTILHRAAGALSNNAAQMLAVRDPGSSASASSTKAYACDAYAAIAGDAIQLHGGIGFTWEHDCHLFLKRAKLNQALFGSSVDHRERVAGSIFRRHQ